MYLLTSAKVYVMKAHMTRTSTYADQTDCMVMLTMSGELVQSSRICSLTSKNAQRKMKKIYIMEQWLYFKHVIVIIFGQFNVSLEFSVIH